MLIYIWFFLSLIPICIGGRFYDHYFLQLYPPLCIIAGIGAGEIYNNYFKTGSRDLKRCLTAAFLVMMLLPASFFFGGRIYIDKILTLMDEENPEIYRPIGEYIKQRTEKDEKIFVWGFATPVYYYADRASASRFLWSDWMTGRISGVSRSLDKNFDTSRYSTEESWDMLLKDLMINKPVYFVDTSPGNYHNYERYPVTKYSKLKDYLRYNFRLEANVNNAYIYRRNGT